MLSFRLCERRREKENEKRNWKSILVLLKQYVQVGSIYTYAQASKYIYVYKIITNLILNSVH